MDDLKELEDKLKYTMANLKSCVDLSLEIKKSDPTKKRIVETHLNDFLAYFFSYIRKREKETGEKLIKQFTFGKLFDFLR